jgi:hypothetical protein
LLANESERQRLPLGTEAQPFRWTATTDQILEKVRRGRLTLKSSARTGTHD